MDYKNPFFLSVLDKGYNSYQTALENAKRFLAMKTIPIEQIAQGTNLPIEKVLELQKTITENA